MADRKRRKMWFELSPKLFPARNALIDLVAAIKGLEVSSSLSVLKQLHTISIKNIEELIEPQVYPQFRRGSNSSMLPTLLHNISLFTYESEQEAKQAANYISVKSDKNTLFPELPVEIQVMVWGYNLPEARIIEIH
jgi:hypothetical protein